MGLPQKGSPLFEVVMIALKKGDTAKFTASCGREIEGVVEEITPTGFLVRGLTEKSNQHEDGMFRFTFA
jgi:hypothetical protein